MAAEELVQAAGLSRGALYHHFGGKPGLFEAVFEEEEDRAARTVLTATAARTDPWDQAMAGVEAFFDVCTDREYRELVLLQGPIALGWRRWRELDQRYLGGLLAAGVRALLDADAIQDHPSELLTAGIYGCLTELSLAVADSGDPAAEREKAVKLARSLIAGIATGSRN